MEIMEGWSSYVCGLSPKAHSAHAKKLHPSTLSYQPLLPKSQKKSKRVWWNPFSKKKDKKMPFNASDSNLEEETENTDVGFPSAQDESAQHQPLTVATQSTSVWREETEGGGMQQATTSPSYYLGSRATSQADLMQHSPSAFSFTSTTSHPREAPSTTSLPNAEFKGSAPLLQHGNKTTTTEYVKFSNRTFGCTKTTHTQTSLYEEQPKCQQFYGQPPQPQLLQQLPPQLQPQQQQEQPQQLQQWQPQEQQLQPQQQQLQQQQLPLQHQQQQQQQPSNTKLNIQKIGSQSWKSDTGRIFEELPGGIVTLPTSSTLLIRKTGQSIWQSRDRRLFEEILFPSDWDEGNTESAPVHHMEPGAIFVGPPVHHMEPGANLAGPPAHHIEPGAILVEPPAHSSHPRTLSAAYTHHTLLELASEGQRSARRAHKAHRAEADAHQGRSEINDPIDKVSNKIGINDLIQHPSEFDPQCRSERRPSECDSEGSGRHSFYIEDINDRSTPDDSRETLAELKTSNLDEMANASSARTPSSSVETGNKCEGRPVSQVIEDLAASTMQNQTVKPKDYDEVIGHIASMMSKCDSSGIYSSDPRDYRKVLVLGRNLKRWADNIRGLGKRYPKYTITVCELSVEPGSNPDQPPPILTHTLVYSPNLPCYLHTKNVDKKKKDTSVAMVGVFVKSKHPRYQKTIHAVTAGHAIANEIEQNSLSGILSKEETRQICQKVIGRVTLDEHLTIAPHNKPEVNVRDTPIIAFSHYIPMERSASESLLLCQKFVADIALLAVDPEQLGIDHLSLHTENCAIHTESASLSSKDEPPKKTCIGGYIDIRNESDIELLVENGITVFLYTTNGKVVMQPKTFDNASYSASPSRDCGTRPSRPSWKLAPHIAITTVDALKHGDSGAAVMVLNKQDGKLYIIGLLMGSFMGDMSANKEWCKDVTIYQVAPLGPMLRQLEHLYPDHMSGLNLVAGVLTEGLSVHQSLPHLHGEGCCQETINLDTGIGGSLSLEPELG